MTNKELSDAITALQAGQQEILERLAVLETKLSFGGRIFGYAIFIVAAIIGGISGAAITFWPW
jgi:hypothetical protein